MKRKIPWLPGRSVRLSNVLAPLLVVYLFVGTCGGSKSGFVLAFKAGKIAVTAGWCGTSTGKRES